MSFGNICKAGKSCCDGARWKTSTINFETNLLGEAQATYDTLHYGKRVFKGFHSFATVEHGKVRNIDALPIQERAIQKCLCKNLLTEVYSRSFIYDNSASLKDRGMDFQLRRLRKHLQDHYRRYGTEGGIYQFDFKNYFGSLPHEEIKRRARKKIMDDRLYTLFCDFVDDFRLMKTADKEAHRGVGLGSEVSQIIALDYASPIDHYVKDVRGIHGYGRYMDDGYVISNSLEELEDIKRNLYRLAERHERQEEHHHAVPAPQLHLPENAGDADGDGQGGDEAQSQEHPCHAAEDGYFPAVDGRGPNGTGGRVPVLSIVESAREAVQQLRHAARHGRALHADVR
jgi:hypothetical protein